MLRTDRKHDAAHILSGIIIVGLLSVALLSGCAGNGQPQEMWGRAEAKEVDINSKIPGRVVSLLVKEGQSVEKGQVLAKIDNRDLVAKVNQAKAGIEALEAELARASTATSLQNQTDRAALNNAAAQLAKTQADLALSRDNYNRFSDLFALGAVSRQTIDSYKTGYEVSQANYAQAQAALAAAQAGLLQSSMSRDTETAVRAKINQAQATLQETEIYLNETDIIAPFAGIITTKYVEEGAMVSTGMPLVAIQDPTNNWVNIKVKETELDKFSLKQEVRLEGRDSSFKLRGVIVDISKKPEFATYRATSERGDTDIITFNVKIQVNSDKLRPGMRFKLLDGGK